MTVLHVGLLRTAERPNPSLCAPGSIVVACDSCGRDLWVDPATCAEIDPHDHVCIPCAGEVDIEDIHVPAAAWRALDKYRRRN